MKNSKERDFDILRLAVGPMAANCYVIANRATSNACLIDPGADPSRIQKLLTKNGLSVKFIINTHGHGDHITANRYFNVPIYIHKLDKDFLTDPNKNLSSMFGFPLTSPEAARYLEDGEKLLFNGLELLVIHTPGHTPGGISVKLDGHLFTGDTLFQGGIGRTDFPYGDERTLLASIREKLFTLSDDLVIHPGHGDDSTIGEERRSNPFF